MKHLAHQNPIYLPAELIHYYHILCLSIQNQGHGIRMFFGCLGTKLFYIPSTPTFQSCGGKNCQRKEKCDSDCTRFPSQYWFSKMKWQQIGNVYNTDNITDVKPSTGTAVYPLSEQLRLLAIKVIIKLLRKTK